MLRRALLGIVLLAAVGGFLLLRRPAPARPGIQLAAVPATAPLSARLARRARDTRPLSPDTRFLDAVGDVEHVLAGVPAVRATADWSDGAWTIRAGNREVARLSEYPTFAELHGALVAWAGRLGARETLATAPPPPATLAGIEGQIAGLRALRAADLADRAWTAGHHDRATARLGARALVWLDAESFDAAGTGEAIPARALAWCAIVQATDSTALASETALLAERLGYAAEAVALAARLPDTDPVRLFVRWDDELLDAIASRGGSARAAKWLALLRTVERRDLEGWQVAADRGIADDSLLALPILSSELALGRFESALDAGAALLGAVTNDLRLNAVTPAPLAAVQGHELGEAMETFETLLESMPESADGAFLDRGVLRAWYRAAFYSSLLGIGEHLRTQLSDLAGTREFAGALGDGSRGPATAVEFQRWFAHLAAFKGSADGESLVADAGGLPTLGAGPRLLTWNALADRTDTHDPLLWRAAEALAPRLDSRPTTLVHWGDVLGNHLFDLPAAEDAWAAAIAATHPRDLGRRGWWAAYRGDRATLDRLLADPRARPSERAALVHALRFMTPGDSVRLDAISESILAEDPDDWSLTRPYVRSLAERHRNDRVRALTRAWLARPDRSARAFDDIDARDRLARACLEDGRIHEGLEAIESVVGSWQESAMTLGAELIDRDGRGAEAETLAMLAWQRYPDSPHAQALAVSLWWRHGDPTRAAQVLARAKPPLGLAGWRQELGPRFAQLDAERPRDARRAVDALVAAGLDDWQRLGALVAALVDAGRLQSALEIGARVRTKGDLDAMGTIAAYRNVKAASGDSAAAAWLAARVASGAVKDVGTLHYFAYSGHAGEVQWLLPIPAGNEDDVENLWLMRAAALARDTIGTPGQREELRAHFATPGPNRYRRFGRLLLGFESADSILAMPLDRRGEGEACYYLGLRSQEEGDVTGAAAWYARCLDAGVWNNGEHHWAMDQLIQWRNRARSLARIGTAPEKPPPGNTGPAT